MKVSKINFMNVAGGVAGGAVAKVVEGFTKSDTLAAGETDYLTIGVQAVVGAVVSAFGGNDLLKGIGSGMIGVAGYKLGESFGIGEDSSTTKVSGLLPSQAAVGLLPSQAAVGRLPFRYNAGNRVNGVAEESKNANVQ